MLDFFKAQKDLGIALLVTVIVSTTLLVLSIVDKSTISEQEYLIEGQIETLTEILGKEYAVNDENLKIAKSSKMFLEGVFKRKSADLSQYNIEKRNISALDFKSKLTNVVTTLDSDADAAGIDNTKKMFATSVKDLNNKRESVYTKEDVSLGLEKLSILTEVGEVTKSLKLSSLEAITWQATEYDDESFTSTIKLELGVTGSQSSITNLVNTLALNPKVFFIVQGVQINNVSKLTKPTPPKTTGTEVVDRDSKESKEVIVNNKLTCKLFIDVVQFKLNQ